MTYTVGSLFSGIGGLDLAAHWAGFETAWFVEKEPFCQKVLAKHWPNVPIHDDVFTCKDMPHVDVIVGGFPCQPFSVAGAQRGRDDERFLLPEMLRIVDEVKPYAVLFENVPGFPSLNNGREFKYLLGTLAEMGFDAEWGHLRASDVGAPHQRERWFCIAYVVNAAQHFSSNKRKGNAWELQQAIYRATNKWFDTDPIHKTQLGNPNGGRCEQYDTEKREFRVSNAGCDEPTKRYTTGQTQSELGGAFNGLPGRMDFCGFPAPPGQNSYHYEPPRTAKINASTNARIKALGNAVVPQCAYPIFEALMEWFKENES